MLVKAKLDQFFIGFHLFLCAFFQFTVTWPVFHQFFVGFHPFLCGFCSILLSPSWVFICFNFQYATFKISFQMLSIGSFVIFLFYLLFSKPILWSVRYITSFRSSDLTFLISFFSPPSLVVHSSYKVRTPFFLTIYGHLVVSVLISSLLYMVALLYQNSFLPYYIWPSCCIRTHFFLTIYGRLVVSVLISSPARVESIGLVWCFVICKFLFNTSIVFPQYCTYCLIKFVQKSSEINILVC